MYGWHHYTTVHDTTGGLGRARGVSVRVHTEFHIRFFVSFRGESFQAVRIPAFNGREEIRDMAVTPSYAKCRRDTVYTNPVEHTTSSRSWHGPAEAYAKTRALHITHVHIYPYPPNALVYPSPEEEIAAWRGHRGRKGCRRGGIGGTFISTLGRGDLRLTYNGRGGGARDSCNW